MGMRLGILVFLLGCAIQAQPQRLLLKFEKLSDAYLFQAQTANVRPLVRLKSDQTAPSVQSVQNAIQEECAKWCIVVLKEGQSADSALRVLSSLYRLSYAHTPHSLRLESSVGLDSLRSQQWALDKLKAEQVWKKSTGKGAVVAIIDTGIEWTHEDLQSQLWINAAEDLNRNGRFEAWPYNERVNGLSGDIDSIDNDANGYVDDLIGYNFVDQAIGNLGDWSIRDAYPFDELGHGTNVAGVIAAAHNNVRGVSGLAYDAKLMTLRAFDLSGNADEDDIASAVLYATNNGARIINCSFGDVIQSQMLRDVMSYAEANKVLVVASSGNSGGDGPHFPSDYRSCMSVGASSAEDRRALFSSFNSQLSLIAPGQGILTTGLNNSYLTVSGTSFSSPITAAAAALLIEQDPELSPNALRSMLEISAQVLDSVRWSPLTGAGRLDVLRALEIQQSGDVHLARPEMDATIVRSAQSTFDVLGSVNVPMMSEWTLEIANLASPTTWTILKRSSQRVIDSAVLYSLDLSTLRDSSYTLRVVAHLTNGRSLQRSTRFHILPSSLTSPEVQAYPIWFKGQRMLALQLRCDRYCTIQAELSTSTRKSLQSSQHLGRDHFLMLSCEGMNETADVRIRVRSSDGDTVVLQDVVDVQNVEVQDTCFTKKSFAGPRLYFNAQSYDSTLRQVYASDLSTEQRSLGVFALKNNRIVKVDSSSQPLFTRGVSRSTNDAKAYCLAYAGGNTSLIQLNNEGKFGPVVFGDSISHTFWATRFADVNADGLSDIIGYRSSRTTRDSLGRSVAANDAMEVYAASGNTFRFLAQSELQMRPAPFRNTTNFSGPGCAVGDFDRDGNTELAFCDANGSMQIAEYKNSELRTEKIIQSQQSADAASEFCTEIDIDGDGTPEIIYGSAASSSLNFDAEYDASVWTFHLLKSSGPNTYKEVWSEHIYGSRYGKPYYNGVSAGQLDSRPGDELVLSLFPNIYVFSVDDKGSAMKPIWYHDNVWSTAPLIADLDGNGRNELAFSSSASDSSEWWEWSLPSSALAPPTNFRLRVLSDDSLSLYWDADPATKETVVELKWHPIGQNISQRLKAFVSGREFHIPRRPAGMVYTIRGVNHATVADSTFENASRQKEFVYAGDIRALSCMVDVAQPELLHVQFGAAVSRADIPVSAWNVVDASEGMISVLSSSVESDSTLLLRIQRTSSSALKLRVQLDSALIYNQLPPVYADVMCSVAEKSDSCCRFGFSRLLAKTPSTIRIEFSEAASNNALDPTQYTCSAGLVIKSLAFADAEQRIIVVEFEDAQGMGARGLIYSIRAHETLLSKRGTAMGAGPESILSWTFSASDASEIFAFPQPFSVSRDGILRFAGIPQNATVAIKTTEGVLIATLRQRLEDGGLEWRPADDAGSLLSSGVYIFTVQSADGSESDPYTFLFAR